MSAERKESIKSFLPCILLLFFLLFFSLFNSYTVNTCTNRWKSQLTEAKVCLQLEEFPDAIGILKNSYKDWSDHQLYLHLFLHHEDVDAIEKQFQRVVAFAQCNNNEASPEIAELLEQIHLLGWEEQYHLQNIF